MAVYVPPGFFDFIMSLNDEEVENIIESRSAFLGKSRKSTSRIIGLPSKQKRAQNPKRKRTVSKYQKAFGKHLKALKKKHPRTNVSSLMKKAHRLTKKELK